MHILLRSGDALIPVWINQPAWVIIVHRTDTGVAERFLLSGVNGDGRLVYIPAAPEHVFSSSS